jgi:5S rRNA maturation endonuclease (ribonuclease M5)
MNERESLMEAFVDSLDCPVIVEGRKDSAALKNLGIGNVIEIKRNASMLEIVESMHGIREVAILTDLDQEGKILRKKLLPLLSMHGIGENKKPREILARMRVSHVEGLSSVIRDEWEDR